MLSALLILIGIALLYYGGEVLVDNAQAMARTFGVSPLVIGLTVVAFATSAPELAATITAALQGSSDMALGNAFGSNIANLGLILGITALFFPMSAAKSFLRREMAFMILVTMLVYPLLAGGLELQRWEGLLMLLILAVFLYTLVRSESARELRAEGAPDEDQAPLWKSGLGVAIGVVLLILGARLLIMGASDIARSMGISERVIGLSLVAVGTSLPELAAAMVAGRKGEGDLVLGNLVGSNIFNLLCILGLTSMVRPIQASAQALGLDFWVMLGISVATLMLLLVRRRAGLPEGLLLFLTYIAYMAYLFF